MVGLPQKLHGLFTVMISAMFRKYWIFTINGFFCFLLANPTALNAQSTYIAPQDTVRLKRSANEAVSSYHSSTFLKADSRLAGAAVKAADLLMDTLRYNTRKGLSVDSVFSSADLKYVTGQGLNGAVALFELVNTRLPKGKFLVFRTDSQQVVTAENPLVLRDLRMLIAAHPVTKQSDARQWQEHVFQAYMARDYGTTLHNTITITSATREMRETPDLELIDFNGGAITLGEILRREQLRTGDRVKAEKAAVAEFRSRTYPGKQMSKERANENYRRALFELMRLQEGDMQRHPETKALLQLLKEDLSKGKGSKVVQSLRRSSFFDANVPGNLGPVLLTETDVIDPDKIKSEADSKAMELMMLTSLHYGERDAVKLFKRLLEGRGELSASTMGDFSAKRLGQLKDHGTEKLKSLGYGADKTAGITFSDLVLLAVAAPEVPVTRSGPGYLSLQEAGETVVNYYLVTETHEKRYAVLFNPRIIAGSRHIEHRSSYDPVDFVPEVINGAAIGQEGSRVVLNGLEIRLESDIYFSDIEKLAAGGVKPFIYPEFGIVAGYGRREVGYDKKALVGPHGAVPQYSSSYWNWGGHIGLNVGPLVLSADATVLSTPERDDPYERFFDLSSGMTYYRYGVLLHVFNKPFGSIAKSDRLRFVIDAEFAGETNNEGTPNRTHTQSGAAQTGSGEWRRDYDRAHPGGVYNHAIATEMILNGDVKASYAASNFAAIHLGIQRNGLLLKGTVGLYNNKTIEGYNDGEWANKLFQNTLKGRLFGGLSLTYSFDSRSWSESHKTSSSYKTIKGVKSDEQKTTTSSAESGVGRIRNHAIFTGKKSGMK